MEMLVISIAVFLNFMLLKWKLDHKRYMDFGVDLIVLIALAYLFAGTMSGMAVGLIAGAMMSLYLLVSPPKFTFMGDIK